MKQRVIGILLSLTLLCGWIPANAANTEAEPVQGYGAADLRAYQSRYEQLLAELLLHLEGYGKQVAHEYYNPSWMNGIAGVGSALLATFRGVDFERR